VQRVFTCAAVDLVERGEGGCGLAIYADGQRIDDVIACRAVEGVCTGSQRNGLAGIVVLDGIGFVSDLILQRLGDASCVQYRCGIGSDASQDCASSCCVFFALIRDVEVLAGTEVGVGQFTAVDLRGEFVGDLQLVLNGHGVVVLCRVQDGQGDVASSDLTVVEG